MAGSRNKVMIIGSVGRDPEGRYTPAGTPVTTFSVATNRRSKEGGEETEWFSVVAWEKLAETCNTYLTKGQKVYVEGRLQTRTWDDKEGVKKFKTEVIASTVLFLSPKANGNAEEVLIDGEMPF